MSAHYPEGQEPTDVSYRAALADLVTCLADTDIRYVFMGGLGTNALARPRTTDDIDLFVHPEDVKPLLERLEDHGFETRLAEPTWLYKAFKYGVLVDLIYRSTGDIYVDDEMIRRAPEREVKGHTVRLIPPEDLLVVKAVASAEHIPYHWHDALGIVKRCDLDWAYLVARARQWAPRRVLSLLLYAESLDQAVPAEVIDALYVTVQRRASVGVA